MIDSREKRASACSLSWFAMLPIADGEISNLDRQQVMGLYVGFAVTSVWTEISDASTAWTDDTENNSVTWTVTTGNTTIWSEQ
jgi:hypothetical protein